MPGSDVILYTHPADSARSDGGCAPARNNTSVGPFVRGEQTYNLPKTPTDLSQAPSRPGNHQRAPQPHSRRQSGSPQAPQYEVTTGPPQVVMSTFDRTGITAPSRQPHGRIVDSDNGEVKRGPSIEMAPPNLRKQGIQLDRNVKGTGDSYFSTLDPTYKIRTANFYVIGRVFLAVWAEPTGGGATSFTRGVMKNEFGELVFSKIRRFVVVRRGATYCTALPILTYGGKGVGKCGVTKSDHAIIYTGSAVPRPQASESPGRGEMPMRPVAILVDPDSPDSALDPMSRIDFRAVHTVQYNIKAKALGLVNSRSLASLETMFRNVLELPLPVQPPPPGRQSTDAKDEDGSDKTEDDQGGRAESEGENDE